MLTPQKKDSKTNRVVRTKRSESETNFMSIILHPVRASFTDFLRECGVKEEADSEERWARSQQGAVPEAALVADNPALSVSPESQVGHKTLSERTYCHTGWMLYILTMTHLGQSTHI